MCVFTCLDWVEKHWSSSCQTAAASLGTHCKRTGSRRRSRWSLLAPPTAGEWMRGWTGYLQSGKWQKKGRSDNIRKIIIAVRRPDWQHSGSLVLDVHILFLTASQYVYLPQMWVCPGPFPTGSCQVKSVREEPCPDCTASFGCSCSSHWSSVSSQVLHPGH